MRKPRLQEVKESTSGYKSRMWTQVPGSRADTLKHPVTLAVHTCLGIPLARRLGSTVLGMFHTTKPREQGRPVLYKAWWRRQTLTRNKKVCLLPEQSRLSPLVISLNLMNEKHFPDIPGARCTSTQSGRCQSADLSTCWKGKYTNCMPWRGGRNWSFISWCWKIQKKPVA